MTPDTIPARLFGNAERTPGKAAYYVRGDAGWVPTSWAEYADQVRRAGKALMALGLEPGQHVTILGFNRPEWVVMDLACMAIGGAPAGIYATSSADEVRYINQHSESPITLVEDQRQLDKVLVEKDNVPSLRWVIAMRGTEQGEDPSVLGWEAFLAKGDDVADDAFAARLDGLDPEALATLIYTSGTTGPPKGVMLTHSNLTWTADQGIPAFGVTGDDTSISYLPLSHIAEQMFSLHIPITVGGSVYFAESIDKLSDNLQEVRPSIFFAVPRVWEKFQTGIAAEIAHATGVKAKIAAWAQGALRKAVHVRNSGRKPSGLVAARAATADRLVGAKVRKAVGLDRAEILASGAAPISADVLEFLAGFGMSVMEVYGQSEGSGPTTFNQPGRTKLGAVGPPFPGVDVKIADDGEILARGGNVFAGYYKNAEATAETLMDGWLYSGDLGAFDDEGYLNITGRKKDIIVTAGGKNVAPKNFEGGLKDHQLVSEAVLIGDRRKFLTALVTLDPETTAEYAEEHGATEPYHLSGAIIEEIQRAVDQVNAQHARVAQVKKFSILPRELSITDGELTGTLKVKRDVVTEHFAAEIESMYQ